MGAVAAATPRPLRLVTAGSSSDGPAAVWAEKPAGAKQSHALLQLLPLLPAMLEDEWRGSVVDKLTMVPVLGWL